MRIWSPIAALLPVVTLVVAAGCNSSVHDRRTSTDPAEDEEPETPPAGEPVELPGSLSGTKLYYQSRGVISLNIAANAAGPGDAFSLFNDTTRSVLVEQGGAALLDAY